MPNFLRKYELLIGEGGKEGLLITDFQIEFDIKKSSDSKMNTATFRIYNLNQEHRRQLQALEAKDGFLFFKVGYVGTPLVLLFTGNIIDFKVSRNGADVITELLCGDGYSYIRDSMVNISYPENVQLSKVLLDLAKLTGASVGNISGLAINKTFKNGLTLNGRVYNYLDTYTKTHQMTWAINDGVISIKDVNSASSESAFVINKDNGLIGVPEIIGDKIGRKKDKGQAALDKINKGEALEDYTLKSGVSFQTLLQPELRPDRFCKLESAFVNGFYVIKEVGHSGSFEGRNWTTSIEAENLEKV
jgi:hypothetical protein